MNNQNKDQEIRRWAMFLHFSLLSVFIIPLAGLIVQIIIWQLKKDEMPELEEHWKVVGNWLISELIYAIICLILGVVLIGLLLLPILAGLSIVFPIIGGIKANEGKVWKYPLSLDIL